MKQPWCLPCMMSRTLNVYGVSNQFEKLGGQRQKQQLNPLMRGGKHLWWCPRRSDERMSELKAPKSCKAVPARRSCRQRQLKKASLTLWFLSSRSRTVNFCSSSTCSPQLIALPTQSRLWHRDCLNSEASSPNDSRKVTSWTCWLGTCRFLASNSLSAKRGRGSIVDSIRCCRKLWVIWQKCN